MTEERISRLLDADFESTLLGDALRALQSDPAVREAVSVYQIIGDALRGRAVEDDGYSRRILAALDRPGTDPDCGVAGNFSPPREPT